MDPVTILVSLGGAALASGGMSSIVTAVARRRTDRAEATRTLTEAAMRQVDQLQERVAEADKLARDCRMEAEDARHQLRIVHREAVELGERLATLARWVHDPYMTLERLRMLVPPPPELNGGRMAADH